MTRVARRNAPQFSLALSPRMLHPVTTTPVAPLKRLSTSSLSRCWQQQNLQCGEPTRVVGNLFLGSFADALSAAVLERLNIRRILNVATECDPTAEEGECCIVKHLCLRDHSDENIATYFQECNEFIHEGLQRGEGVLVHCRMGVSRSATIVMAYLMAHGLDEDRDAPCPYDQVLAFVKSRRPQVSPNLGFVLALHELDEQNGFSRVDVDDMWANYFTTPCDM